MEFYGWAIAHGYSDKLSIERKDNDEGYFEWNCSWITTKEQANNRRTNRNIEYNGKTQTIAMWARELSVNSNKIKRRLDRGWSVEKTIETP